jgi:hypothetical protein
MMTDASPAEQSLEQGINESVNYAARLKGLDRAEALKWLASEGDLPSLERQIGDLRTTAAGYGRSKYLEDAMIRGRGALADAVHAGLAAEEDAASDDAPSFWCLNGDDWKRLEAAAMIRAGSYIVAGLL